MACLNFCLSLNKMPMSSGMCLAKIFLKKSVNTSPFKGIPSHVNFVSSHVNRFKGNSKFVPLCLTKSCDVRYHKITRIFTKHPIKNNEHSRHLHTSERRYLGPLTWAILRPTMKFVALITGRCLRNWWKELPPNRKQYFWQVIKKNKNKITLVALACILLSMSYYVSHLEEAPFTKRKRFIAFDSKQLEKINQFEFQQLMEVLHKHILPPNHPSTRRVQAVVDHILNANLDIEEVRSKKFTVAVINSSEENAFVLPNGFVCVFRGMLSLCSTDDELGIIISHEIAHCIQGHGAEKISLAHLLDLISILFIAALWALIPSDSLSILAHWLYSKSMKILLELPYDRNIEKEADYVGLHLAAKACLDVRESSAFWSKLAFLQKNTKFADSPIEFLSTHPSHETRSEYLDSIMDKAITFRCQCGCPKLKPVDPRLNVLIMAKALEITRQKYLKLFPKPESPFHI